MNRLDLKASVIIDLKGRILMFNSLALHLISDSESVTEFEMFCKSFVQSPENKLLEFNSKNVPYRLTTLPMFDPAGSRVGYQLFFSDNSHQESLATRLSEEMGTALVFSTSREPFSILNKNASLLFHPKQRNENKIEIEGNCNSFKQLLKTFIDNNTQINRHELELFHPILCQMVCYSVTFETVETGEILLAVLQNSREMDKTYHQEQKFSDFEKATAIGRMAAQIAHEVNNPLEVIKNSLYLLQNSLNQQDQQTTKFLEVARKETERVSNIIKQMLVFPAKINRSDTKYVDVNRILEEIVVLVEKTLKQHQIDIKLHLFNNLPTVFISEDKLKQVILNLVLNSKEAMQDGGILSLSTALQSENIFGTTSVVIEVSDTGRGIEQDHLKDIFEPFVSFKKERGTGLGLWICQAIIHTYGGKIEVKSSIGKGSSFAVIIPLSV